MFLRYLALLLCFSACCFGLFRCFFCCVLFLNLVIYDWLVGYCLLILSADLYLLLLVSVLQLMLIVGCRCSFVCVF